MMKKNREFQKSQFPEILIFQKILENPTFEDFLWKFSEFSWKNNFDLGKNIFSGIEIFFRPQIHSLGLI